MSWKDLKNGSKKLDDLSLEDVFALFDGTASIVAVPVEDAVETADDLYGYTGEAREEDELTFGEHQEACDEGPADVEAESLTAKMDRLLHKTLDDLLDGNIAFENAAELWTTMDAVYTFENREIGNV